MKAAVINAHGSIGDIVIARDWPDPAIEPNHVVVRVGACSLNYHDLFTLKGMPGITLPMPLIMGIDVAGEIVSTSPCERDWKVGDRVLVDPRDTVKGRLVGEMLDGGLAELCKVGTHQLIRLPEGIPFSTAAALPVAYGTAYRMMIGRGAIKPGERILILGASGGVGTCCVQLAKMHGLEVVVAASSESKLAKLREIGADVGINYLETRFDKEIARLFGKPHRRGGGGVDVVVNFTGGDTWVPSLRCLNRYGRMLTCGATAGYDPPTDIRYIWTFEQTIIGSNGWDREDLVELLKLVESDSLAPLIDRCVGLDGVQQALQDLSKRNVVGKIIIDPSREDF